MNSLNEPNDAIALLFNNFKGFFEDSVTEAEVVEQWVKMKAEIKGSDGLMSRKFHDLWAHMLVHFHDEYPRVPARAAPCGASRGVIILFN